MSSDRLGPMSAHNPFRSPAVTPNPTGASAASSSVPSYATLPPIATFPTGDSSASNPPPSYSNISQANPHSDDEESPEALPELTPRIPSARTSSSDPPPLPPRNDSRYGPPSGPPPSLPRRTPPIDILPPSLSPELETAPPPAYSASPDVGQGELVVQQGPRRPFQRAPEPFLPFPTPQVPQLEQQEQPLQQQPPRFAPPPGPPPGALSPPTERPRSQMSDFAQDFYNAGAGTPPTDGPQPYQPRYAPPPGAPPPRRRAASTSSGAGSTAPTSGDGRPTTTPTPGHPLLRNGQTLVYPDTYTCQKCQNTGYKNFDPSHPCRKCWDRFGKSFTSILASSPWGDSGGEASQSQRGHSFQRPLPAFKPPQASSSSRPPMPGAYPSPTSGPPPGMQQCNSRARAIPYGSIPPPGATVVMPGDPRIGGRLCWRCGGRGTTPFLIFDEMTCETCGGIGRLMN